MRATQSGASRAGGAALAATLVVLSASQASTDDRVKLMAHVGYANAGSKPVATYDFAVQAVPYPVIENGKVAPFRGGFTGELAAVGG